MAEVSILHVPDLHYESLGSMYLDDDKADVPLGLRESVFRNLRAILKSGFDRPLDAVTVGGDITTQGKTEGFARFLSDAAPKLRRLVRQPGAVCLVPGNHDVAWGLEPTDPKYFQTKFKDYNNLVKAVGATSSLVPTGPLASSGEADIKFKTQRRGPIFIDHKRRLLIVCINSSIRCGEVNQRMRDELSTPIQFALGALKGRAGANAKAGTGGSPASVQLNDLLKVVKRRSLFDIPHATPIQLEVLRDALQKARADLKKEWVDYIKVALLHHHLVPFASQRPEHKPFEMMADASEVMALLGDFGVQIVLTGHKHQPYRQPVRSMNTDLLVLGGLTVGGYAAPGFAQGVRWIGIDRRNTTLEVKVVDVGCDWQGDIATIVRSAIARERPLTVEQRPRQTRVSFPTAIEGAVEEQLYSRTFYKTGVKFVIKVAKAAGRLKFLTTMSYRVVNRTGEPAKWMTEYNYDVKTGRILEARFNDTPFDASLRDFRTGRGLSFPYELGPREEGRVYVRIEELFDLEGSNLFTSYYPATDLEVVVNWTTDDVEFDAHPLYFWKKIPVSRTPRKIHVHFTEGLLPYQGLRLQWARRRQS